MKLTNKVYNKLKSHSLAESKKGQRVHEKKEHSTVVSFYHILFFVFINYDLSAEYRLFLDI